MFIIIGVLIIWGVFVMIYIEDLFMLMPIYRSDECRALILKKMNNQGQSDFSITYRSILINQLVFEFCNWVELAYLYFIYKKLTMVKEDQLNIKQELKIATICWIAFSLGYFLTNLINNNIGGDITELRWVILFGILARNLFTFYATCLFTLHTAITKKDVEYGSDRKFNLRLNVLNLDIIMTHQMPFQYFKLFVSSQAQ